MFKLKINQQAVEVKSDLQTPILWVLRDELGLTGTKYSCGMAQCGACTIHIDGEAVRACVTPLSFAKNKEVITIEGLDDKLAELLRDAWTEIDVPQCGYCQSGQIMSAHALLKQNPKPSKQEIDREMSGNICRCGTYQRIRQAIYKTIEDIKES